MKKMNVFQKTFFYSLALFAGVIFVVYLSVYIFLPVFYIERMEHTLDEKMEVLSMLLQEEEPEELEELLEGYAKRNGINIAIRVGDIEKNFQGTSFLIEMSEEITEDLEIKQSDSTDSILVKNKSVRNKNGTEIELRVMMSVQPGKEAIELIRKLLPLTAGAAVVLSILFSYLYSRKITRPIYDMLEITENMKELKKDAYFSIYNEDEIGVLGKQMNEVYSQLWQTIDSLEKEKDYIREMEKGKLDFLRAASHELKTPLARLRILLENMRYNVGKYKDHDTYLQAGIETIDELSGMVKEILDSSRIQGEVELAEKELLSVKEEMEEILKDYRVLAKSRDLEVELEIEENLSLEMNRKFFQRVWSNLIANAILYSDAGGTVRICGAEKELSVWNPCTPLSEEETAHIFEAFYRPDFSRDAHAGGNGLGLYIVKEILEANHMRYSFCAEEHGMKFRINIE